MTLQMSLCWRANHGLTTKLVMFARPYRGKAVMPCLQVPRFKEAQVTLVESIQWHLSKSLAAKPGAKMRKTSGEKNRSLHPEKQGSNRKSNKIVAFHKIRHTKLQDFTKSLLIAIKKSKPHQFITLRTRQNTQICFYTELVQFSTCLVIRIPLKL